MAHVSIAIPVYNEAEVLTELHRRLDAALAKLPHSFEIVFADDGSTDETPALLAELAAADPRVRVVRLSRNFGHQAATTAAFRHASGDAVVLMDADLQDPPEVISELIDAWSDGARVVLARRRTRKETGLRGVLLKAFHPVYRWLSDSPIPSGVGSFSLLDRRAADELAALPENNRYLPGLRWWIGFETREVEYDRDEREAGRPSQTLGRLLRLGLDAIFSFSYKPLRAATLLGLSVSAFSFTYAFVLIVLRLLEMNVVRGFTTQTVTTFFLGGVQLVFIGILGEYLLRILDEVKARPLYIVESVIGGSSEGDTDRSSTGPRDDGEADAEPGS